MVDSAVRVKGRMQAPEEGIEEMDGEKVRIGETQRTKYVVVG